ncbi:MAG: hypothetical protein RIQ33_600 [Bacteroidota bacterium]
MIAAIHQPNFVPWIGYFYKIEKADVFVLLDDVQFTKNSFINRNQIKTPQGAQWLTLPALQTGKFGQNINEVGIVQFEHNIKKVLKTVEGNYKKAPFYTNYFPEFENCLLHSGENMAAINIALIKFACNALEIKTPLIISSELKAEGESTMRLINICKQINATKYLSGFGGNNYQEAELYKQHHIELTITNFKHPQYKQLWGDFVPNMSIIDLLFNHGKDAAVILKNAF